MKKTTTGAGSSASTRPPSSSGISRDEWLKAMQDLGMRAGETDQSAMTIMEFAEMFGLGRVTANKRLLALEQAGKARRVLKRMSSADGRNLTTVAYKLVTNAAPAKS